MWLAAKAIVDAARAEPLSDALLGAGAASVDIADADAGTAHERAIFDEPDGQRAAQWTHARVIALFEADADVSAAMESAFAAAEVPRETAYEVSRIEDEDWVRKTQSQFTPQQITERLWIVPTWHDPPDPHALNIVLDPGLAFGTGTHPTTRLCLRWLDAHIRGGETVLDFGCGSGILAIAAAKLGAARLCGIDIDPHAVSAARANAHQNQVDVHFVDAVEALQEPSDIVVANILARPLIVLAPMLAHLTRPGGRLALSGILAEQTGEVVAAYADAFDVETPHEEDGWALVAGVRRR